MAMSTVASEKKQEIVYRQRVLQTVTFLRVVLLVFRRHDLLKIANINPQQEATLPRFAMEQITCSSPREQWKWSLGLVKPLGVMCLWSHSTRK